MSLRSHFEKIFGGFFNPAENRKSENTAKGDHARLTDLHETLVGKKKTIGGGGGYVVRTSGSHGSTIGTGSSSGGRGTGCAPNIL